MGRKIFVFCMAILLVVSCVYAVSATEELDYSKTGSFSVTLTEQKKKEPIVGAELSVYYVATVKLSMEGRLSYILTEEFEKYARPLILGTPDIIYENGLPKHIVL